ncbi:hypothetical protein Cob_v012380 [Colletotrichum orbiculare MAFF 240422]|uniref:Uncharacterized protein n=1 Tax=Colletotrichum orbiculare (strain 104-T / ATCC 96160 / CBS 514.97 / LARS 414 / MAFF 240422) TaxID=1213857 RepID=A0A484F8T9_COLOR|nr:hypothetical protein Cob_v012380 [Colletotrichum orbiculare MAFF 240422]
MGSPPDHNRTPNNNNSKSTSDRRSHDSSLIDLPNRRPGVDRHVSRNGQNSEDIILGPPRTAFASATLRNNGGKPVDVEKDVKNAESPSRFSFRNRNGDTPETDRFRDSRNNNGFRRRGDNDQDNEGWSTVKPRKSFGHEGAERFHGRMGAGGGDRLPNERRPRDRDDREANKERPHRNLDNHDKDKDHDEAEPRPRNGLSRGKSEPWFKNDAVAVEKPPMTARERIDRAKSWRDRDKAAEPAEEKPSGRNYERRWERGDHRNEREPEWFDEPAGEKAGGHTEEDFKKFMESMKASRHPPPVEEKAAATATATEATIKAEQPAVASAPAVESGPDQFFLRFAPTAGLDVASPSEPKGETPKPKTAGGKSSRFTSFFNAPQEDSSRKAPTEPPTPLAGLPFGGGHTSATQAPDEKEAFQALLMKLQRSNIQSTSTPPASQPFQEPPQVLPQARPQPHITSSVASPEPFQHFGGDRREESRPGLPQGSVSMSDIFAPRPMMSNQQPAARQDQLLQELVGQRHQASSSGSGRMDPNQGRNNLTNTEFLMNLMKAQPEPPRTEQQLLMRIPQPQRTAQVPHPQEREPDFPQAGRVPHPRQMRPPGFMDDGFHHPETEVRIQPTQILQRPPPPPGLDQMNPNWMQGGGPMPPQPRSMIPPPGLAGSALPGGPGRNHPMAGMFPPNFPPGAFPGPPPPENMAGPPSRNMPPPPGFFGGPPPGFIPPPGMPGFPGPGGPEGHGFPFDGRMPPGAAQAFRRQ